MRDRASAELRGVEHRFEPALAAAPPGEVRNRLTAVAAKMRESGPPAELVTDLRGIDFLAEFGTLEARRHLDGGQELAHRHCERRWPR
ncbi:hypothetical protein J0H58_22165 [bacterium]|nr:hypothetical protein [bacterium]